MQIQYKKNRVKHFLIDFTLKTTPDIIHIDTAYKKTDTLTHCESFL